MAALRGGGGSYERGTPVPPAQQARLRPRRPSPGFIYLIRVLLFGVWRGGLRDSAMPAGLHFFSSSLLLSSLELSDTNVYEPYIRARLGTAAHFCEGVVLNLRTVPIGTALSLRILRGCVRSRRSSDERLGSVLRVWGVRVSVLGGGWRVCALGLAPMA